MNQSSNSKSIAIFDPNIAINGVVLSSGIVHILGEVNGTIIGNQIFIKQNAKIKADLFIIDSMVVEGGSIVGNIYTRNIKLLKNAVINGNIYYSKISIEDGAIINGNFTRLNPEEIEKKISELANNFQKKNDSVVKSNMQKNITPLHNDVI